MQFIFALVLLGIIIFVHELGHFLFAKLTGVKVLKFSLGFGPKLLGKKVGDTEYMISALPLGGYVKMLGDNHEEDEETLNEADLARAYNRQPVWKRFLIIFAGPLFNIVFAAVVFTLIFAGGVPALLPEVGELMEDMPAKEAGLQAGDRIVRIGDTQIKYWAEMSSLIHENPGKALEFEVKRAGRTFAVSIKPKEQTVQNVFGEDRKVGLIGMRPSGAQVVQEVGFSGAIKEGVGRTIDMCWLTVVSIVKLIQRIIPAETIGGPILIFQLAGQQASQGAMNFFSFMAVISINLGILNLLPIPVLDGGHLAFLGIEAIRRRPLNERTIMAAQKFGLVFILLLMALAFYNDFMRLMNGREMP